MIEFIIEINPMKYEHILMKIILSNKTQKK